MFLSVGACIIGLYREGCFAETFYPRFSIDIEDYVPERGIGPVMRDMKCAVCGSAKGQSVRFDFPFYRHLDFARIADRGRFFRCGECYGLSFDYSQGGGQKIDIDAIYQGDDYIKIKRTSHVAFGSKPDEYAATYELQADYLAGAIRAENPAILDIGCFDGKLLKEFRKIFDGAELCGFDVSVQHERYFSDDERIRFYHTDLSGIDARFDLITVVNVINYVEKIGDFVGHLKRLLKKDGMIYIEAMDINKNPCQILCGDLYTQYNRDLLQNLSAFYGLRFGILDTRWAPRSIGGMARFDSGRGGNLVDDKGIFACLEYLNNLKDMAEKIKAALTPGATSEEGRKNDR